MNIEQLEYEAMIERDRCIKVAIRWLVIGGMTPVEAIQFAIGDC